jgi:hypothetical protein
LRELCIVNYGLLSNSKINVKSIGTEPQVAVSLPVSIGKQYRSYQRPNPRTAAIIHHELTYAHIMVNVNAGVGSYEP